MPTLHRVWPEIVMDEKRKSDFLEDEITAMTKKIEATEQVLFSGLNRG